MSKAQANTARPALGYKEASRIIAAEREFHLAQAALCEGLSAAEREAMNARPAWVAARAAIAAGRERLAAGGWQKVEGRVDHRVDGPHQAYFPALQGGGYYDTPWSVTWAIHASRGCPAWHGEVWIRHA